MDIQFKPYDGYGHAKINNVEDIDIPEIVRIVNDYNNTMRVSNNDLRWLMKLFVDKLSVSKMEIDISCSTCKMKTLNCFIGYVRYWKEIGKI